MTTLRVSTQAQLDAAITNARNGDTILLSQGTYDHLEMVSTRASQSHVDFDQKVTIASADPSRPAVINELFLRGAENVELKGLKLDYNPSKSDDSPFTIESSRNITLNDVTLEGHVSGAYGAGIGLSVKKSQGVDVLNSEVLNFRNGLNFTNISDVRVAGTDFRGISNDAMLVGGASGMTIEDNDFRAMKSDPGRSHKDMIQFYNSSSVPSSRDIVIRDNVIDNPEVTHAILFGNALAKGGNLGAYFRNILIEDNYIRSAHVFGVTIDHGADVTIRDNTILQNPDKGYRAMINTPLINVSTLSTDVTITGNRVESVPDARPGWQVSGNVTGSKNVVHWDGDYRSGSRSVDDDDGDDDDGDDGDDGSSAGGGQAVGGRINGDAVDGETRFLVADLDFSSSDVITFTKFDRGTFVGKPGGNPVQIWENADGARVDSALDLQELAARSPDVTAATQGDDLILRIAQDDGVAEIVFEGLGAAFRAADQPDLF